TAGDEVEVVACAGAAGAAPVLTGTASGVAAADGVAVAPRPGTGDPDAVLGGGTESGNPVRGALGEGIGASAGTRVEVDAGDERGTVTCAGAGEGVSLLAETESGVATGDGVFVDAVADTAFPVLAATESGGGVRV